MPTDMEFWHRRYLQQASWTRSLRQYILAGLPPAPARTLEVGCGTGAVLAEFPAAQATGIDLEPGPLWWARASGHLPHPLAAADGRQLPFAKNVFDLTVCHFLLLWVRQPEKALAEMVRVTRTGGWVAAFAEPDYGGRLDYPPELEKIGAAQMAALEQQGADPRLGRRLMALLTEAGLQNVRGGVLGGEWQAPLPPADLEWDVLAADLAGHIPAGELEALKSREEHARQTGTRTLFVPTFYALGQAPA